jgi:hypothetical protein
MHLIPRTISLTDVSLLINRLLFLYLSSCPWESGVDFALFGSSTYIRLGILINSVRYCARKLILHKLMTSLFTSARLCNDYLTKLLVCLSHVTVCAAVYERLDLTKNWILLLTITKQLFLICKSPWKSVTIISHIKLVSWSVIVFELFRFLLPKLSIRGLVGWALFSTSSRHFLLLITELSDA